MDSIVSETQYGNAATKQAHQEQSPNETHVEECTRRLVANDASLIDVNINNVKGVSKERIHAFIDACARNTKLEKLSMANMAMNDDDVKGLVNVLEQNNKLKMLNVESNLLSGEMIAQLLRATLKTQTLIEFRAANQRAPVLGNKLETQMVAAIEHNVSLLRVGIGFESKRARERVGDALERNLERTKRSAKAPPKDVDDSVASLTSPTTPTFSAMVEKDRHTAESLSRAFAQMESGYSHLVTTVSVTDKRTKQYASLKKRQASEKRRQACFIEASRTVSKAIATGDASIVESASRAFKAIDAAAAASSSSSDEDEEEVHREVGPRWRPKAPLCRRFQCVLPNEKNVRCLHHAQHRSSIVKHIQSSHTPCSCERTRPADFANVDEHVRAESGRTCGHHRLTHEEVKEKFESRIKPWE